MEKVKGKLNITTTFMGFSKSVFHGKRFFMEKGFSWLKVAFLRKTFNSHQFHA